MTYVCEYEYDDWRMINGNAEKTAASKVTIQLIGG